MICERWDVVLCRFPFADRPDSKLRPVAVLSTASFQSDHGIAILTMITAARAGRLPTDHDLVDLAAAGLNKSSVVRWKIMTLASAVISRRIGQIGMADRLEMADTLRRILPYEPA